MNRIRYMRRVTLHGSMVNFLLVIFKFFAGVFGHSAAMVADAAHSLSDFASDIIILLCLRVSAKPEDEDHSYGHGKFETLASVAIGLILLLTGLSFLWSGIRDIVALEAGELMMSPSWLALTAAIISILSKEALYHYTMAAARKAGSDTLKVNAWHHRSDALSSIATLAGIGGAIFFGGRWVILDPLAACLISFFIMGMAWSLLRPGIDELMEKSLPKAELALIEKILSETPGILGFHHVRTRRMGVNRAVEAHIKLDGNITLSEAHDLASLVERRLKEAFGQNTHTGIHMEPLEGKKRG